MRAFVCGNNRGERATLYQIMPQLEGNFKWSKILTTHTWFGIFNHMVEYTINLDSVFSSLADATRRDILNRVSKRSHSIGELAEAHTSLTFAAVAKHISVLQDAQLVIKKREGRYQIITINPKALKRASHVLEEYKAIWDARFDALDTLLQ